STMMERLPSSTAVLMMFWIGCRAIGWIALPITLDVHRSLVSNTNDTAFSRCACSNVHVLLHPSRLTLLPSSHCSPASRIPLPQTAAVAADSDESISASTSAQAPNAKTVIDPSKTDFERFILSTLPRISNLDAR